ncbi:MAG TPA: tetratricopeptide repeat protein [Candidatus Angelobacter sp.]|nr:tetratricopeptide repeat protein [Candidatus Angelobacter sp.]
MNRPLILCVLIALLAYSLPCAPAQTTRRVPEARSRQEYQDYMAATAITDGALLEKAADDFAARFPASELRVYLYSRSLHQYQNEDNPEKMLEAANKVLTLDPDNSVALATSALVMADSLTSSDPARDQKIWLIRHNCDHALETMDSSLVLAPGVTAQDVAAYKALLGARVHSALGIMELKTGNDRDAENDLKLAAGLNRVQGDASVYYHLALAQDHQKKYAEAVDSAEQALQLASASPALQQLAEVELERLQKLAVRRNPQ